MTRAIDLLVVGAGPAGSALATLATRAGARTVVLERGRFPREKVCGEFVSAEGLAVLERLGLLPELLRAGATRIDACRISDRQGRKLDLALPASAGAGRPGCGISRRLLDLSLAELAQRSGAELRQRWEAREPIVRDGRVRGFRARAVGSPAAETFLAELVVAADGRRSVLGRRFHPRLGDPRTSGRRSWFGLKTHLAVDTARLGRRVELHLFDGGYAGLAPVESSRVNLCMLTTVAALRASGGSPERLLRERLVDNPALRESIRGGRVCTPWSSCGPLRFGLRRPAAAGAIFIGDAAGTVDPFSGEGISNALLGAEVALPFALEAVSRGELSPDLARAYRRAWIRTFAPVTRRVRRLGLLFGRPRLASAVLALLRLGGESLAPRLVGATRTGVVR